MYRLRRVRVLNLEFRVLNLEFRVLTLEFFLPLSSVVGGRGLFAGRTSPFRWLNRCDLSTESPRPACWIFVPFFHSSTLTLHPQMQCKVTHKNKAKQWLPPFILFLFQMLKSTSVPLYHRTIAIFENQLSYDELIILYYIIIYYNII